jgi:hypothetical protein
MDFSTFTRAELHVIRVALAQIKQPDATLANRLLIRADAEFNARSNLGSVSGSERLIAGVLDAQRHS